MPEVPYSRQTQSEKDIRGCFKTGAKRVSIDFTEGTPSTRAFQVVSSLSRS